MRMLVTNISAIFAVLILQKPYCNGVIILDSGNPAPLIRGSFVDTNHPEFFGESIAEMQANNFPVKESVGVLNQIMVDNLDKFIAGMGNAIANEAVKTDAASTVNTCRMSRTKLYAMKIMNTFESKIADAATATAVDEAQEFLMEISDKDFRDTKSDFMQMTEDLQHYDEAVNGREPMIYFQKALTNFDSLQLVKSDAEAIVIK